MKINRSAFATTVALGLLVLIQAPRLEAASPPTVTTVAATNVTPSSATLKGSINPGGTNTTVWFEWGPGDAIRHQTTPTSIGSGLSTVNTNAAISGLTSGLTYRYRAVASNALGVIRGRTLPFGVPTMVLNGASVQTNAQYAPYVELGAVATAPPAGISVGDSHTLALRPDGSVAAWGANGAGQITVSGSATNAIGVAAGYRHSLALKANGSVVGWGTNDFDQITLPPEVSSAVTAIAAGGYHSLALKTNGTVVGWGSDLEGQTPPPESATNVVAIAAGYFHSLAVQANGVVIGWGDDSYGQATPPQAATNMVAVAAGNSHSLALRANRTVLAWGGDSPELTAVPPAATNVVAIAVGFAHNLALRADGTVVAWGLNEYGEITVPGNATNVIAIGAGFGYSQALRADGSVISWGDPDPDVGQTITPTNLVASFPVTITGTVNTATTNASVLYYSATNVFGYAATTTRTIHIRALRIGSISRLGNGNLWLAASFVPGKTIEVLTATNFTLPMASWTALGYASEPTAGNYTFTNSHPLPKQFFRLRLVD